MKTALLLSLSCCLATANTTPDQVQGNAFEQIGLAIETSDIIPGSLKAELLRDLSLVTNLNKDSVALLIKMPTEPTRADMKNVAGIYEDLAGCADTPMLKGLLLVYSAGMNHDAANAEKSKRQFMGAIDLLRAEKLLCDTKQELQYFHSSLCEAYALYLTYYGRSASVQDWKECVALYADFACRYPEYSAKTAGQHVTRWLRLLGESERFDDLAQFVSLFRKSWEECLQQTSSEAISENLEGALAQVRGIENKFEAQLVNISLDE